MKKIFLGSLLIFGLCITSHRAVEAAYQPAEAGRDEIGLPTQIASNTVQAVGKSAAYGTLALGAFATIAVTGFGVFLAQIEGLGPDVIKKIVLTLGVNGALLTTAIAGGTYFGTEIISKIIKIVGLKKMLPLLVVLLGGSAGIAFLCRAGILPGILPGLLFSPKQ